MRSKVQSTQLCLLPCHIVELRIRNYCPLLPVQRSPILGSCAGKKQASTGKMQLLQSLSCGSPAGGRFAAAATLGPIAVMISQLWGCTMYCCSWETAAAAGTLQSPLGLGDHSHRALLGPSLLQLWILSHWHCGVLLGTETAAAGCWVSEAVECCQTQSP